MCEGSKGSGGNGTCRLCVGRHRARTCAQNADVDGVNDDADVVVIAVMMVVTMSWC